MGGRPITRPESLLESVRLEDDSIETDSFENDSDAATESPPIPGPSKEDTDSLNLRRDDVLDLSEGENMMIASSRWRKSDKEKKLRGKKRGDKMKDSIK